MNRILHDAQNAERILQMTADTLILVSKEGICVDISVHSSLWFLQEDVLLGKNLFELLPEHTLQKILPTFQEVISKQKFISRNYCLELSDATYYFKCIMHPYDANTVLCQYRDITERSNVKLKLEKANQELLQYESQIKRLNRIMDIAMKNLPASIVVKEINNDFRYIYCNREQYIQDINAGGAIGKNDFDYHSPEVAEAKQKEDLEITQTGKELHRTLEETRNGKLRVLDKRKIKVESKDFSPIIVSIEWDITPLELVKRELMAEKNKAEASDHLKSAFLANMSHEIRTPLNAIVGFSHLIAESEDPDERKAYYEIVDANNERLLQLINEILDLSKIESGIVEFTITPVKLHRLCKEIHDAHVFRCPAGVKLIFEPSDEMLIIDSDKNRVFQVLSNMIGNAFKFTSQGSVSYGYRQEGDFVLFHVTDTGIGIQADKVGRVFERFVKVNNHAQGTGLGLSICKTIIERLGGEVSVTSEMGVGTTFTFTLPTLRGQVPVAEEFAEAASGREADARTAPQNQNSAPAEARKTSEQQTILIAEDTDSNYELLKAILGREYHLERAMDGMQAVTLFDELRPDLILMDLKMPNLDGLEATKIIRELSPSVPIIIQSAYAFEHDLKQAAEAGCNDFIAKPIAQSKLREMIKKYMLPARGGAIQVGTEKK